MLTLASEGLYSSGGSRCDLIVVRIFMRIFMSELIFNNFRYMKFIYLLVFKIIIHYLDGLFDPTY